MKDVYSLTGIDYTLRLNIREDKYTDLYYDDFPLTEEEFLSILKDEIGAAIKE